MPWGLPQLLQDILSFSTLLFNAGRRTPRTVQMSNNEIGLEELLEALEDKSELFSFLDGQPFRRSLPLVQDAGIVDVLLKVLSTGSIDYYPADPGIRTCFEMDGFSRMLRKTSKCFASSLQCCMQGKIIPS